MKIESISIQNFRCFGSDGIKIELDKCVTAFVGNNGSGKTAVFFALSRLFGITSLQRTVKRQDFHIPVGQPSLSSGATLSIEVFFVFPELDRFEDEVENDAVPELFNQMAASGPGESREREEGRTTENLSRRPESPDGQEDEQEPQHQRRRDLQHPEDFTGDVLPVFEGRGVIDYASVPKT